MEKIRQRGTHDCGVACLATLTGVPYEIVEDAFRKIDRERARGRRSPDRFS